LLLAVAATFVGALGAQAGVSVSAPPAPYIASALGDPARPDDEKKLDADRKPAEVVAFAGIQPGSRVLELMAGGGYFTHIFAKVVGDKGYVYVYTPSELDPEIQKRFPGADPTKQFAAYNNVTVLHQPIAKLSAPEQVDVVFTSQNYHDLHDKFMGPADLAVVNKA